MKFSIPVFLALCLLFAWFAGCISVAPQDNIVNQVYNVTQVTTKNTSETPLMQTSELTATSSQNSSVPLWVGIDPICDHKIGDKFTITGTTNLNESEEILVSVIPEWWMDVRKRNQCGIDRLPHALGTIRIVLGENGINKWIFSVDTTLFPSQPYVVDVDGINAQVFAHTSFNVTGTPSTGSAIYQCH